MKRSILTIMLLVLLFNSPVLAEPNLFDALFNAIQQHPKTTLMCALAGCAASAKIAYNYAYESTLHDRQTAHFFKTHPMIVLLGESITDEQKPVLQNFELHNQGEDSPNFLLMRALKSNDPNFKQLINETNMPDYQFVYHQEGQPFPIVGYSKKLQPHYDPTSFNNMLNQQYASGHKTGYDQGYDQGRIDSSSGKLKEKTKQAKEKIVGKITNNNN